MGVEVVALAGLEDHVEQVDHVEHLEPVDRVELEQVEQLQHVEQLFPDHHDHVLQLEQHLERDYNYVLDDQSALEDAW